MKDHFPAWPRELQQEYRVGNTLLAIGFDWNFLKSGNLDVTGGRDERISSISRLRQTQEVSPAGQWPEARIRSRRMEVQGACLNDAPKLRPCQ